MKTSTLSAVAFAKLLAGLCEANGRVWLTRQDDGAFVVTSRTSEPVHVIVTGKAKG